MTNHKKSLGDFLDELDTIESLPQKLAKIDEHLKKLVEENKEDEENREDENTDQDLTSARNAEIAQILGIRQNLLSPPSSPTLPPPPFSSLQPPASSNPTELREIFPSSVSSSSQPPESSNRPRLSNFSSSPSSAFQPFLSSNRPRLSNILPSPPSSSQPPESSNRSRLSNFSSSPSSAFQPLQSSSNRPRLRNILPAPLSSSPSPFVNPFLPPQHQDQDPTIPNFRTPRPQIFQGPLDPLPNPNPRPPRLKWTDRLQGVFDEAVARLGGLLHATPKPINELMAEKGLTESQISSHLQILRKRQRDIADNLD